jgi:uncharacterized protein with PQ loop repeat
MRLLPSWVARCRIEALAMHREFPMALETLGTAANFLQSCVPLLSLSAYIPQWRRLVKTKSSADISIHSWLIWCFSGSFALFYAFVQYQITGTGAALVFSTSSALLFVFVTVFLVFIYRRRPAKNR